MLIGTVDMQWWHSEIYGWNSSCKITYSNCTESSRGIGRRVLWQQCLWKENLPLCTKSSLFTVASINCSLLLLSPFWSFAALRRKSFAIVLRRKIYNENIITSGTKPEVAFKGSFLPKANLRQISKGGKFLKKLWCCVGGFRTLASDEGLTLETSAFLLF